MISERVADGMHPAARRLDVSVPQRRWPARPIFASRQRAVEALGRSVLVQLMLAMSFLAFAAMLYLAQASQASIIAFDLASLKTERIQLNAENANLHTQVNQLQSLQRIDTLATTQLHMTKPNLSTTTWVHPLVPRVSLRTTAVASETSTESGSQPLAWSERFLTTVKNSL